MEEKIMTASVAGTAKAAVLVPLAIQLRMEELRKLITDYPVTIPVKACAKYLHLSLAGMPYAILDGCIPGAICWRQPGKHNHCYRIETLLFYQWQTGKLSVPSKKGGTGNA